MSEVHELDADTCRRLLAAGLVGRIAVCTDTGPHLVPVNLAVVDDAIVLRTSADSVLGRLGPGAVVAVEIDHVDHPSRRGWSVVATGIAEAVTDPDEVAHVRRTWDPRPWAAGDRGLVLRIPLGTATVTGRQVGRGWTATDEPPVRRRV